MSLRVRGALAVGLQSKSLLVGGEVSAGTFDEKVTREDAARSCGVFKGVSSRISNGQRRCL